MGYQLWRSPLTGYRRRGTSAGELRALFAQGVTARAISEPLRCCLTTDLAEDVRPELARLDFDVAGVMDFDRMRVIGWVVRDSLRDGACGTVATSFETHELISDSTPIIDIVHLLADTARVYVVEHRGVSGIITRADLQKPPVRALLFGLISLLDMHLTYWVNELYPGGSWHSSLSAGRLQKLAELLEGRLQRNENVGELDCLQMADKREILSRNQQVREVFGFRSKTAASKALQAIEGLRDRVAHSQADLTDAAGWSEVAGLLGTIDILLQRSDAAVEGHAAQANTQPVKLVHAV